MNKISIKGIMKIFAVIAWNLFVMMCGSASSQGQSAERSFSAGNGSFLLDGSKFRYISGSMHYHRTTAFYWKDRLLRMKYAGLNTVQFYIPWNYHEVHPGVHDFYGDKNLTVFLDTIKHVGMFAIVRAGPYINNEWEFGGIPWWLLSEHETVKTRSMDPVWISAVDRWMNTLLPILKPHLYINGGHILMVQMENEYGSYPACDLEYREHLRGLFHKLLGSNVQLYTTDGPSDRMLQCGTVAGVYPTIDFGPGGNFSKYFEEQDKFSHGGPWVNSEYYTGWIDHWGEKHASVGADIVAKTADQLLAAGANINFYTFTGATSFGFYNGANYPKYQPQPTNYDFDAPIGEGGVMRDKYTAIRNVVSKYNLPPAGPVPDSVPKAYYGRLRLSYLCHFLQLLPVLNDKGPTYSEYPLSMEQVGQGYGLILYRHAINKTFTNAFLNGSAIRDRAYVLVDDTPVALLDRRWNTTAYISGRQGQRLDVLVENTGRINFDFGYEMNHNRKGIVGNLTLDDKIISNWTIYPLDLVRPPPPELNDIEKLIKNRRPPVRAVVNGQVLHTPSYYQLYLSTDDPKDTFINLDGWTKGQAFINRFNLGRYWPAMGPQKTIYIPADKIAKKPFECKVTLIELERSPCYMSAVNSVAGKPETDDDDCYITFQDTPIYNGTIYPPPGVDKTSRTAAIFTPN